MVHRATPNFSEASGPIAIFFLNQISYGASLDRATKMFEIEAVDVNIYNR